MLLVVDDIKDWSDLNEHLFSNTYNETIKRHRSTFAYRGVNVHSYQLENGLMRLGKPYDKLEENLIQQFKKYAHANVVE